MYQALYRKWRPRNFDEVVGQPHVTETLKKQLITDRLSHAYLFIGTRGTGKTSCAKILAKAVNCENPEGGNPCNRCPSCVGIDNGSILDVEELDAASNNGVDNIRALREEAVFTPAVVKKRVYIVDEVHMLSTSAFNALLKILEEPPPHLMFILATTESHKIPATILSRCQRYSFKRVSLKDIARRIKTVSEAEGLEITDDAVKLLSRLADGSVRDALSLLDQCIYKSPVDSELVMSVAGMAGGLKTAELLGYICRGDAESALALLDDMYYSGKGVDTLLSELGGLARDLMILKIAPRHGDALLSGAYDALTLKSLSSSATPDMLMSFITVISSALTDIGRNSDPKLMAELCIITLASSDIHIGAAGDSAISPGVRAQKDIESGGNAEQVKKAAPAMGQPDIPFSTGADDPQKTQGDIDRTEETAKVGESGVNERFPAEERESREKNRVSADVSNPSVAEREDIWPGVLGVLKKSIDAGIYAVLSDSGQVTGMSTQGELRLYCGSEFTKGMIDTKDITSEIRKAAEVVCGSTAPVKILLEEKGDSQALEKLDKLSKFDNFSFK